MITKKRKLANAKVDINKAYTLIKKGLYIKRSLCLSERN